MQVTHESNLTPYFSKADELLKENKAKEARDYIRKGIAEDIECVAFLDIFHEKIATGETITFIVPKKGFYSKEMILDGFSFYSYVLQETIEFLLSNKYINQVVSLNNVTYLADVGPTPLMYFQSLAKKLGGEIKYVNASTAIRQLSDMFSFDREGYPTFFHSISDAIADFHELKQK